MSLLGLQITTDTGAIIPGVIDLDESGGFDILYLDTPATVAVLGREVYRGKEQRLAFPGRYDRANGRFNATEVPLQPVGDQLLKWLLTARLTFGVVSVEDGVLDPSTFILKEDRVMAKKERTGAPVQIADQPTPVMPAGSTANVDTMNVEIKAPVGRVVLLRLGSYGVLVASGKDARELANTLVEQEKAESLKLNWRVDGPELWSCVAPTLLRTEYPFSTMVGGGAIPVSGVSEYSMDLPFGREGIDFELDSGVAIMVAPTGWGKTTFLLNGLVPSLRRAQFEPALISYVEPIESAVLAHNAIILASPLDLLRTIGIDLLTGKSKSVLVVDSLRAFAYGKAEGGTGKGGFDQSLYSQLTAINNLAIQMNRLLVMALNPLIDPEERQRYAEVTDALASSVTTVFIGTTQKTMQIQRRGLSQASRNTVMVTVDDLSVERIHDYGSLTHSEDPVPRVAHSVGLGGHGGLTAMLHRTI